MAYWMICDGDGYALVDGVSDNDVERISQELANSRGESVFSSECLSCDEETGERTWGKDVEYEPSGDDA